MLLVDTGATISVLTKEVIDIITQKNPRIHNYRSPEYKSVTQWERRYAKYPNKYFVNAK